MTLRNYFFIWLVILIFLTFEYYNLNFVSNPAHSILRHFYPEVSPEPGRPLSLFLGWVGIGLMLIMNLYILRKRAKFLEGVGKLSAWLDFHIFCGMVGPTCILYHCNFKVRGLVAISFWSMVVSVSSGVVGRYFYVQLVSLRKDLLENIDRWKNELKEYQKMALSPVSDEGLEKLKRLALIHVGIPGSVVPNISQDPPPYVGTFQALVCSVLGDFRLFLDLPKTGKGLAQQSRFVLKDYALQERRKVFLEPFRRLMGHWHTFHTPFAVFMYLAAMIHIAAALILGVSR